MKTPPPVRSTLWLTLASVVALSLGGCATNDENETAGGGGAGAGKGPKVLCNENGSVRYRANQVPGAVIIFADGNHNRAGYHVFFEKSPLRIFPPQHILYHNPPAENSAQVITPFHVRTQFAATEPIETVIVRDAKGSHRVRVDQTPD